jgi:hypothetical protein
VACVYHKNFQGETFACCDFRELYGGEIIRQFLFILPQIYGNSLPPSDIGSKCPWCVTQLTLHYTFSFTSSIGNIPRQIVCVWPVVVGLICCDFNEHSPELLQICSGRTISVHSKNYIYIFIYCCWISDRLANPEYPDCSRFYWGKDKTQQHWNPKTLKWRVSPSSEICTCFLYTSFIYIYITAPRRAGIWVTAECWFRLSTGTSNAKNYSV